MTRQVLVQTTRHLADRARINHRRMMMAIDSLPSQLQAALTLIGRGGEDIRQVAESEGCSVADIQSRINRAKKRIGARVGICIQ